MNIYWSSKDIPALKGLTPEERAAEMKPVTGKVWRHWQVWLPYAAQAVAFIAYTMLVPPYPYRFIITLALIVATVKLATLPFHHYVQYYLEQEGHK
jgi:hypothetical protein